MQRRSLSRCLEGLGACLPGRRQGMRERPGGRTRASSHVSGCHTCVGVELSGLDIVTLWFRPSQRLTATGDSSVMDARLVGVEVDEANNVY